MRTGTTRKAENKAIRQESLRELLAIQGHHQHVVDSIDKIAALKADDEHFRNTLDKHKTLVDLRMKLVNKYIPDLKAVEVSGDMAFSQMSDSELDNELRQFEQSGED